MAQEKTVKNRSGFPTTEWSVVLEVASSDPGRALAALEKLCGRYWYPIYAFVRQNGTDVHKAEDLTQGFFAFVLEHRALEHVEPSKGRFRSFILASLNHYIFNERDQAQCQKRGGGHRIISFDECSAEEMYLHEAADRATPDKFFERRWAVTLVRRVLDRLLEEFEKHGNSALFSGLKPYLTNEPEIGAQEALAKQLGMETGAVKVALHRARRKFGRLLRREVAHTVSSPEDVEGELRYLLAAIAE
jgi:RNA polymerase sigma-70 factor (ECF subfamily)